MLPGVGFTEMLLLVVIGIVVIGPKDLPLMMRKFGRFTGRLRAMAFEFKQGFEELGRQAELEELRKEVMELKKQTGLEDLQREIDDEHRNFEKDVAAATRDVSKPTVTSQTAPPEPAGSATDAPRPDAPKAEAPDQPAQVGEAAEGTPPPRAELATPETDGAGTIEDGEGRTAQSSAAAKQETPA